MTSTNPDDHRDPLAEHDSSAEAAHEDHAAQGEAETPVIAASPGAGTVAAGSRLEPGAKRTIKWVGGAIAVAFAATIGIFFMSHRQQPVKTTVEIPNAAGGGNERDVKLTPYEEGQRAERQRELADRNRQTGGIYVPPPSGAPEQAPVRAVNAGPGPGSYGNYAAVSPGTNTAVSPDDQARAQAIQEGLNRQLQELLKADNDMSGPAITRVAEFTPKKDPNAAANAAAGAGRTSFADGAAGAVDPTLPGVLTIHVGRLSSPIDTGATSYATATISSGQFAGAFLKGTSVLNNGEGLRITFDTMRMADGRVVKINAVALDEQTSSDAINGNIDRHVLTKYVLPIAFATLQGGMNAIAQRSSELVSSGLTTSVVVPEATNKQAGAAGLAAAGQVGQQIVQGMAQQPNTATVPVNTTIGIMFLAVEQPAANGTQQRPAQQAQALTAQDVANAANQRAAAAGQAVTNAANVGAFGSSNVLTMVPSYGSFALPPGAVTTTTTMR